MKLTFPSTSDRTGWPAAVLSLLPFFIAGPVQVALSFQTNPIPGQLSPLQFTSLLISSLAILIGFGLGAALQFPRWAYPYTFLLPILLNIVLTNTALAFHWTYTGEGSFFLFLALLLGVLALPAFRSFYRHIALDWTLLSYGLFGFVLYLLASIDHDETPRLTLQVLLPSLLALAAALAHLRIPSAAVRILVLLAGTYAGLLIWLSPLIFGMVSIWVGVAVELFMVLGYGMILTAILLAPPLLMTVWARWRPKGSQNEISRLS
jgi:hypothetical protein